MTELVFAEYNSKGITLENIILPKKVRDSNPCPLKKNDKGEIVYQEGDAFFSEYNDEDFIKLK